MQHVAQTSENDIKLESEIQNSPKVGNSSTPNSLPSTPCSPQCTPPDTPPDRFSDSFRCLSDTSDSADEDISEVRGKITDGMLAPYFGYRTRPTASPYPEYRRLIRAPLSNSPTSINRSSKARVAERFNKVCLFFSPNTPNVGRLIRLIAAIRTYRRPHNVLPVVRRVDVNACFAIIPIEIRTIFD